MKKDKLEIEISILDEKVIEEFFYIIMQLKKENFDLKSLKKSPTKIFLILFGLYLCGMLVFIILAILKRKLTNALLNGGVFFGFYLILSK